MKVLRIVERIDGENSMSGKYVKAYDPTYHDPDGSYDGGILEVTDDPADAIQFADAGEAMAKWKQVAGCKCHGTRWWDGKPNRPLTAFTVSVEEI